MEITAIIKKRWKFWLISFTGFRACVIQYALSAWSRKRSLGGDTWVFKNNYSVSIFWTICIQSSEETVPVTQRSDLQVCQYHSLIALNIHTYASEQIAFVDPVLNPE